MKPEAVLLFMLASMALGLFAVFLMIMGFSAAVYILGFATVCWVVSIIAIAVLIITRKP